MEILSADRDDFSVWELASLQVTIFRSRSVVIKIKVVMFLCDIFHPRHLEKQPTPFFRPNRKRAEPFEASTSTLRVPLLMGSGFLGPGAWVLSLDQPFFARETVFFGVTTRFCGDAKKKRIQAKKNASRALRCAVYSFRIRQNCLAKTSDGDMIPHSSQIHAKGIHNFPREALCPSSLHCAAVTGYSLDSAPFIVGLLAQVDCVSCSSIRHNCRKLENLKLSSPHLMSDVCKAHRGSLTALGTMPFPQFHLDEFPLAHAVP